MSKPIRVFWSPLTKRFYATQHYKDLGKGNIEVTGQKFDVTNDIAAMIVENDITFTVNQ